MALDSPADVIGYGGAAGGGKTDLQLGAALTRHRRSIIFRQETTQMRDIIERSRDLIGDYGRFNENLGIWRGIPGDRRLEFGGLNDDKAMMRYRGRAHDLKAYDEVSEMNERRVRFTMAWNRSVIPGQRCRSILCFNPPTTEEGYWVIRFFAPWIDPSYKGTRALPGELRYFAMVEGKEIECESGAQFTHKGETITPKSRTFIPAKLEDNPALLASGYGATLEALPEPLRTQLRTGSMTVGRGVDAYAIIPRAWAELARERGRIRTQEQRGPLSSLGVDVARGGDDETAIAPRYGQTFGSVEVWPGKETPDGPAVATLVIDRLADGCAVMVDGIGVGGSAYDQLRAIEDLRLTSCIASAKSEPDATDRSGNLKFYNDRARWWWRLREALDPVQGDSIALPDDDALIEELCIVRFSVRSAQLLVEDKDQIRARLRLGRSPNRADAVVLAHQDHAGLMLW